jgi:NADPH-dependent 2,4-dienoyl-CoA reductase/sulfur reductase-like enzyme
MRLVVIGGVAAGLSAAARARRCDPSLDITVLEKGEAVAWAACGLPYYLQGRVQSLDELVLHTPDYFRRERKIDVRTGANVVAIAHPRRQVALSSGERVPYDRLVVATGARPDRSIDGVNEPGVFALSTLEDARRIRSFLLEKKPKRAVVIGAGYIGLEAAEALRTHGAAVTVFDSSNEVLGRHDPALTDALRKHLERFHVDLQLGVRVKAIEPGCVAGRACDMAIVAAGLQPNVEIAADAGIGLGRTGAIAVNDRMETNLSGVYAAGDCAETTHLVTGRPIYAPLGTTANKTGRVAGANAAGRRERFPGVAGTCIVRVCGLGVGMTGLSEWQARREGLDPVSARIEDRDKPRYFLGEAVSVTLVADRRTGRLIGGTVLGREGALGRINVIAAAVTNRMRVEDFEQLDLAYAPPYAQVWDPLLIAAQQLSKKL